MKLRFQYVPYVGDGKRAIDEYTSEIFMEAKTPFCGHNTLFWLLPSSYSAAGSCSKLNERANSTLSDLWLQFSPSSPRLHLIS
ncbi:hypothetical protein CISIN_1g041396mg [Citrus sinensis]|uniref:Uncharacterized protein n=2 Tax=Citrus TaxID=2706 RepID=A0A067DUT8_CITSI|nr:hypothetical protein CISIN_1g041396mg [Citrus sinensis]